MVGLGCCSSREGDAEEPPYPPVSATHPQSASSRHITTSSPPSSPRASLSIPNHAPDHGTPQSPASQSLPEVADRPNRPLFPLDPTRRATLPSSLSTVTPMSPSSPQRSASKPLLWTRARLEKERADWWDTRTTGSTEIWGVLRATVAALQLYDLMGARALCEAAECTCPSGYIWKGVFDGRGEWYRIPEWLVFDIRGLVEDEDAPDSETGGEDQRAEEGGLGKAFKVKVRLSTSGKDVVVSIRRGEKVGAMLPKVKSLAKISPFATVRIVYGGRVFDEKMSLEAHPFWRFESHHVLVAMVLE